MIDPSAVRIASAVTQAQIAEIMGVAQAQVSRIEHQTDWRVSTLAAYLAALDANAELVVKLSNGKTIRQRLTG